MISVGDGEAYNWSLELMSPLGNCFIFINILIKLHDCLFYRMAVVIEELGKKAKETSAKREDLLTRLDGTLKVLAGVRAGLEHIAEKLEASLILLKDHCSLLHYFSSLQYIHFFSFKRSLHTHEKL